MTTEALLAYALCMCELAMPAGSLQMALIAFENGADAVYLGLKQFSARKGAINFSFEDLLKLRKKADEMNKAIYITINTIIRDEDIPDLTKLLKQLEFIGTEGIIVQDLGVARIIRKNFPSLPLHGSTQLAVHTPEGVRALQEIGFTRVVLSRELTLSEIKNIRIACPDIELKVFIHGALCYSFSGLCMASHQICGRSANGGACAQICRNWFEMENGDSGYYFSMKDMDIANKVRILKSMGIDSLKVEGRMKGAAYIRSVTRYYRALLDGDPNYKEYQDEARIAFSRNPCGGWLGDYGRNNPSEERHSPALCNTDYPGHRGLKAAVVEATGKLAGYLQVDIRTSRDIALRDGLMFLRHGDNEPVKIAVSRLQDRYASSIVELKEGRTGSIIIPDSGDVPQEGDVLYLVSRHDMNIKAINENIPSYQKPIDMTVALHRDRIVISNERFGSFTYDIEINEAHKKQNGRENIEKIFRSSDRSLFRAENIEIIDNTGLGLDRAFLPLSVMKQIRREFYDTLDEIQNREFSEATDVSEKHEERESFTMPDRNLLCDSRGIPFYSDSPFTVDNIDYYPLNPITYEEERMISHLDILAEKIAADHKENTSLFGINNISQIRWARRHPELRFYIDIYMYAANSHALMQLMDMTDNIVGGYLFMEMESCDDSLFSLRLTPCSSYRAPLFISRSCFRHDSLGLECHGCPRKGEWHIRQNSRKFRVVLDRCTTYLLNE